MDRYKKALEEAQANRSRIAGMPKPRGERTTEAPSFADIAKDTAGGALTAGRNVAESTLGAVGDMNDLRYDLAELIASLGKDYGSSIDQTQGVQSARDLAYTKLPNTEDVTAGVDKGLGYLPKPVQDPIQSYTKHEPTTPWGQAAGTVTDNVFDPMNFAGVGGIAKAGKGLLKLGRKVF